MTPTMQPAASTDEIVSADARNDGDVRGTSKLYDSWWPVRVH
jgi:hypothetical protein